MVLPTVSQLVCCFRRSFLCIVICGGASLTSHCDAQDSTVTAIDFDRDVRPLLSDHCYKCHGPDDQQLQAGLRLDISDSVFSAGDSGATAVVPGKPLESEVLRRVKSPDDDERMPPPEEEKVLSPAQIAVLEKWIEQGARWENHWAFEPIRSPSLPTAELAEGKVENAIDLFILRKLNTLGLSQSPRESKERLIRRVALDLTGLPPSLEEVDSFLSDFSDEAYERVVDRLLASQHFGERLAVPWLDLARYGDTSGYHNDSLRDMWLWREWVIQALNNNLPFDEFTKQQLAGDLLPEASINQQIASGFHRNVMTSDEGGLIDAEYRNLYVVDRVATTGVTWLGLTVACAQCHDHKYDPVTQADFYRLYAFFNNVPENGKDGVRDRNPKPFLRVPSREDAAKLNQFEIDIAHAQKSLTQVSEGLAERQAIWEVEFASQSLSASTPTPFIAFPFEKDGDGLQAEAVKTLKATTKGKVKFVAGAVGKCFKTTGKEWLEYGDQLGFTKSSAFSVAAYLSVSKEGGSPFGKMDDANGARGWDVEFHGLRPSVHLISKWPSDAIHIQADQDLPENTFTHVAITYDGSGKAEGLRLYINGALAKTSVKANALSGEISNAVPFSIGRRGSSSTPFQGMVDELQVYRYELAATEVTALTAAEAHSIARLPLEKRSDEQQQTLSDYFQRTQTPELLHKQAQLNELVKSKQDFESSLPNTMVMSEMEQPRETFIKVRGNYDQDGEKVTAAVPAFLPQVPNTKQNSLNRLDLAEWLVSREHPLTARVAVNRWWAILFGNGIVKTLNDFGSQGERPTHPELLDWLAADFRSDWDIKRSIKQMVMSATYQQTAQVSPELVALDSENRWLARGPRQRLDAEFLRDNALAIAGILNPTIGGKSIKPAQPEGTWEINEMSGYKYEKSTGADLYRRGLYVYWRRSTVYPSFVTLDAPTREFCVAQRAKTSTPLQSLVLMNDPVFVEAARALAQRVLADGELSTAARLETSWRLALARSPTQQEFSILARTLQDQLELYQADQEAAKKLVSVGDLPIPAGIDIAELAAWTTLSNVILNLNETLSN